MRQQDIDRMKAWFAGFCREHALPDREEQQNLTMKEQHTHNVCDNIREITASLAFAPEEAMIAEAIALFHDAGRFVQYARYKTFRDDQSENHAALSVRVLEDHDILGGIPEAEQALIKIAIRFHNVFAIPALGDERQIRHLKLIRDADKIDILRVFVDAYEGKEKPSAIGLGLPETDEYSAEAVDAILRRKIFALKKLRTIHDFRLLQLSWVFDLNFTQSLRIMHSRDYPRRIAAHLPQTDDICRAVDVVLDYMKERITHG